MDESEEAIFLAFDRDIPLTNEHLAKLVRLYQVNSLRLIRDTTNSKFSLTCGTTQLDFGLRYFALSTQY